MKPIKALDRFWNRNSFFYKVRFALLLKNIDSYELKKLSYNEYNDKDSIPELYYKINKKIFKNKRIPNTDFDKTLEIAVWLRKNIKGGKGLGVSSGKSLSLMLSGGFGVCSDFCQVFNNFCVINDIKVREWGILNTEVNKDGHSFNEFYASELKQWILIDVYNSVYFTSISEHEDIKPLSTLEVFEYNDIKKEKKMISYNSGFKPSIRTIKKYYSKKMHPFLVDKYRNKFYDKLLNSLYFMPLPFIHGLAILLNRSYNYKKISI